MKILVTGGCGYKGSVLVPTLLEKGHEIISVDTQWFGNYLSSHPKLKNLKSDIRDLQPSIFQGVDVVIHLANIANDPAVELNPNLSWEVNVLGTQQLIEKSRKEGVKQFIFASSGSVYGVKDEDRVTEDLDLVPISVYNKTKMIAERVLLSYKDDMAVHCIRPATVCGYSPRMRLDVSVNMFTYQALKNGKMTIFGGDQTRPNIHIKDMVNAYLQIIETAEHKINGQIFNVGFQNMPVLQIANLVKNSFKSNINISVEETDDNRSYHISSKKIENQLNFKIKYTVDDAIKEIIESFEKNKFKNSLENENYFNIKN